MEHRFREDENELPYLVSQKRDDERRYASENNLKSLKEILFSMDLSPHQHIVLEKKLVSFLNSRDCTGLTVESGFGDYMFVFTRENRYVKTIDRFEYIPDFNLRRIFSDCYTSHDYDNLLRDSRFQDLIRKTGMEFEGCSGGYVTEYRGAVDEFIMKDEPDVHVMFKEASHDRAFRLNLERMELGDKLY